MSSLFKYILLIAFTNIFIFTACSAEGISGNSSMNGGRGLLYMQTARTFGTGIFSMGFKSFAGQRKYEELLLTDKKGNDLPGFICIPITLGLTDEIDLSAAFYGFHDLRTWVDEENITKGYSSPFEGKGSSIVSVKIRLPISMQSKFQLAGAFGAVFPTSEKQADGLNYRWTRTDTDIDASVFQTYEINKFMSIHFMEGYTISGSKVYDDQIFGGTGIEMSLGKKCIFSIEANNRTFIGTSPETLKEAGSDPEWYFNNSQIGDPLFIKDTKSDFMKDFFIISPSLSFRLNDNIIFNAGMNYNLADQLKPEERYQIVLGISFFTQIKTMIDSDNDGVRNRFDMEPKTPSGYMVDQFGKSIDTDKDGVPDGKDKENNTPQGALVDVNGNGIDSDKDGVYDGIDIEPHTLKGATVDRFGVAIDDDRDGVPNILDKEPNTPKGAIVDKNGVSIDNDGDGVPNGIDLEPETLKGAVVDLKGVAKDTDSDGVPDGLDMEPKTPSGNLVDRKGKSLVRQNYSFINETFLKNHILFFAAYTTDVKPEHYKIINDIGEIMIKYPSLKIQISGHTDKSGNSQNNMDTARKRAESVYYYLTKRFPGINKNRIRVIGYGADKPYASNKTAEGRALNRRVEFTVIK